MRKDAQRFHRLGAMSTFLLCLLPLMMLNVPLIAAEVKPAAGTETRVKRVALFKNGLGFFVREGTLSPAQQTVLVGPFAAPAHGTFWVSAPASAGLTNVIARQTVVKGTPLLAKDAQELMRANVGKEVVLPDQNIVGTIIGFAPDRPMPIIPLGANQMGRVSEASSQIIPWGRGEYVLIKTVGGIVALNPNNFGRISFASDTINTTFQPDLPGAELEATFTSPKQGDWLSVSYLAKGITWAPSYLVDISDGKLARLTAKAVIVNEAEDLKGAHIDLITGFPNLKFADIYSPMAMRTNLATFLQQLGGTGARPEALAANVMTQAVRYRGGGGGGGMGGPEAEVAPSYGAAVAGQTTEDLFLYPVENLTLAQGETGYYPLFTESVPFTEFYEWEIPDYVNAAERYAQPQPGPQAQEVVWHSIRLTNATRVPWTTAPAELLKSGQIIGQDVLNYTPVKAEVTVRITQAASIRAEQTETEVNRERDAVALYGDHFDRVTIQGELSVTSYQDKAVSVEIKKTVSGEIKSTKPPAKDVTLAQGLKRMSPVHQLTWTVQLKPGEGQKITYTYQALIRR